MNTSLKRSLPSLFKGIALFTPGGDLVYCIDPGKQGRWHLNLCAALQTVLELPEPPHFLVPCYTATFDRWLDTKAQQVRVFAEAYPLVFRYKPLLNAIFEAGAVTWQMTPPPDGLCDPVMIEQYRQRFPQLWENHDLVLRLDEEPIVSLSTQSLSTQSLSTQSLSTQSLSTQSVSPRSVSPRSWGARSTHAEPAPTQPQGYVLRLFVSGYNMATQRILQDLHELLEQSLDSPYTLKVIDIFKHPEQAELDQVSATPTLVKVYPKPVRRLVGDLDDRDRIVQMLGALEDRE